MFNYFLSNVISMNKFGANYFIRKYGIDMQDNDGNTILHCICNKKIEIIQFWLCFKPDCKIKNNDGLLAIDIARKGGDLKIINLLISYTYKICILLSGEARSLFGVTYENYKSKFGYDLSYSNIDIYVYTSKKNRIKYADHKYSDCYTDEKMIRKVYGSNLVKLKFVEDDVEFYKLKEERINELKMYYKTIDLSLVKDEVKGKIEEFLSDKGSYISDYIDQYLRFNRCFDMIEKKYDIVIRLRFDAFILGNVNLDEYYQNIDKVCVIPYPKKVNMVDFYLVSNMKNMSAVADAYKYLGNYIKDDIESISSVEAQLELYMKERIPIYYMSNALEYWNRTGFLSTIEYNQYKKEIIRELNLYKYKNINVDLYKLYIFFIYFI